MGRTIIGIGNAIGAGRSKASGPQPVSDEWLWFQMPEGGTVTLNRIGSSTDPGKVTLEISLDNGQTWIDWTEEGDVRTKMLEPMQVMHIRNKSDTSTGFSRSDVRYYNFAAKSDIYAGGNVNSLLCKIPENAIITEYCYCMLFRNMPLHSSPNFPSGKIALGCYSATLMNTLITKAPRLIAETCPAYAYQWFMRDCRLLTDVSEVIMPISLAYNSCSRMFQNTAINESPLLRCENPAIDSYFRMFSDCANLNLVKTNMKTIDNSLTSWMFGVAEKGDFYCPSELTITTGNSGIPSGWTRHDI